MGKVVDTPFLKVLTRNSYLYGGGRRGYTPGYLFAATGILNRPILFNVHLETGAVFCRLPISAFCHKPCKEKPLEILQPWACLGNDMQVIQHEYLKDSEPEFLKPEKGRGRYLMSFDFFEGGWSETPEQSKTYFMIESKCGAFFLLPQNHLLFRDEYFTDNSKPVPRYKRNTTYFVGPN